MGGGGLVGSRIPEHQLLVRDLPRQCGEDAFVISIDVENDISSVFRVNLPASPGRFGSILAQADGDSEPVIAKVVGNGNELPRCGQWDRPLPIAEELAAFA